MSVEIPWCRVAKIALRPQLFSGNQEGALGGWTLPIPRMGDRFAADIATAQLRQDDESRLFAAALMEATTADGRIQLRLPNVPRQAGFRGAAVDGAGQSGSTLALRGVTPGVAARRGQYFSIVHGGLHHVHMVRASGAAGADGRLSVAIWPMLRFLTADGDACAFDVPMIEGQLVGFDARGAAFSRNRTEPFEFSIVERG